MKVACLYSGGKDSNFALFEAKNQNFDVSCLITMISENKESYMFQTPGVDFTKIQAECLDIPIIEFSTKGEKEKEVDDLKDAILKAKEDFGIEGIVTGAIKSTYQGSRIQRICNELDLYCFNPLWQIDEKEFMEKLIESGFDVKIIGVFAYPLDKSFLNLKLDNEILEKLVDLNSKFDVSVAGEGGELETFVCDSPIFKKRIEFEDFEVKMDSENSGVVEIKSVRLVDK